MRRTNELEFIRKVLLLTVPIQLFNALMDYLLWFSCGFMIPSWTLATIVTFYTLIILLILIITREKK